MNRRGTSWRKRRGRGRRKAVKSVREAGFICCIRGFLDCKKLGSRARRGFILAVSCGYAAPVHKSFLSRQRRGVGVKERENIATSFRVFTAHSTAMVVRRKRCSQGAREGELARDGGEKRKRGARDKVPGRKTFHALPLSLHRFRGVLNITRPARTFAPAPPSFLASREEQLFSLNFCRDLFHHPCNVIREITFNFVSRPDCPYYTCNFFEPPEEGIYAVRASARVTYVLVKDAN